MQLPKFFIYGLLDPDSYELKYIGQSKQGIRRYNILLSKHSVERAFPKDVWIKSLIKNGKLPLFKILEVCDFDQVDQKEIYWINKHKETVLNIALGGVGGNTGKSKKLWKPVISKNMITGEIKRYNHIHDTELCGFSATKVCAVCQGKRKSHLGHYFYYENDKNNHDNFKKPIFHSKKPIICTELSTGKITRLDSIREAALFSKKCVTTVSNAVRGKTNPRGFKFEYEPKQ